MAELAFFYSLFQFISSLLMLECEKFSLVVGYSHCVECLQLGAVLGQSFFFKWHKFTLWLMTHYWALSTINKNKQLKTELPCGQHRYADVHEKLRPQEFLDHDWWSRAAFIWKYKHFHTHAEILSLITTFSQLHLLYLYAYYWTLQGHH